MPSPTWCRLLGGLVLARLVQVRGDEGTLSTIPVTMCDPTYLGSGSKIIGVAEMSIEQTEADTLGACFEGLDKGTFPHSQCLGAKPGEAAPMGNDCVPPTYPFDDDSDACRDLNDRIAWQPEWVYAKNCAYNSGGICMHCCSNSKHTDAGELIEERWDLRCGLSNAGRNKLLDNSFRNTEFRFRSSEQDNFLVACPLGRMGCKYKIFTTDSDGTPQVLNEMDGRPLSCGVEDNDFGSCNTTVDGDTLCTCNIPGTQTENAASLEQPNWYLSKFKYTYPTLDEFVSASCGFGNYDNLYLTGYDLDVTITEHSDLEGNYWRQVESCSAVATERDTLSVSTDWLQQNFVITVVHGDDPWTTWASPVLMLVLLILFAIVSLLIRWRRDVVCATCMTKLIYTKKQCLQCLMYSVDLPDEVLLRRLSSRSAHLRGPGSFAHTFPSATSSSEHAAAMKTCATIIKILPKQLKPPNEVAQIASPSATFRGASSRFGKPVAEKTVPVGPGQKLMQFWRKLRGAPEPGAALKGKAQARVHVAAETPFEKMSNQFGDVVETRKQRAQRKRQVELLTKVPTRREQLAADHAKTQAKNMVRTPSSRGTG